MKLTPLRERKCSEVKQLDRERQKRHRKRKTYREKGERVRLK